MSTHHKATALRYLDLIPSQGQATELIDSSANAIVHAELETAAQIERMADGLEQIKVTLEQIGGMAVAAVTSGGLSAMFKPFNPEEN